MIPPLCGFLKPIIVIRFLILYYIIQAVCKIPLNLYFRQVSPDDPPHAITLQAMIGFIIVIVKLCTLFGFTMDDFNTPTVIWTVCSILDVGSLLFAICIDYIVSDDMPDSN